jgi:hypothetical protein
MGNAVMIPSSAKALTMAGCTPSSANVFGFDGSISNDVSSVSIESFSEMVLRTTP